jgi:hypothetical protein
MKKRLVEILDGKEPLERLRSKWKDNIKIDLRGRDFENVDCTQLSDQWRYSVYSIMNPVRGRI